MQRLETTKRIFRINRKDIGFLKFIFEAYDGIAVLTTLDSVLGTVRLSIAPGCEEEVAAVLADLQETILMEPLAVSGGPRPAQQNPSLSEANMA
jgi:hypothetical protein